MKSDIIQTERLKLRPWTLDDLPAYLEIARDAKVMRYVGNGEPNTTQEATFFVLMSIQQQQRSQPFRWAVENLQTRELIGWCGLGYFDERLEIGWRFAHKWWGKGLASEAAIAAMEKAIAQGFHDIWACSYIDNPASIAIIEKLGMKRLESAVYYERPAVWYRMP